MRGSSFSPFFVFFCGGGLWNTETLLNPTKPYLNYSFKYGVNKLNNVKSYKYLRMILNPYGNFSLAREELKKVGLKALYKLRIERDG